MARPQLLPKLFNVHPFGEKMKDKCGTVKQEKKNNTGWIKEMDRKYSLPKIFRIVSTSIPLLRGDDRLSEQWRKRTVLKIKFLIEWLGHTF